MVQTVQLAMNRYMAVMPKLVVASRKIDVNTTALKKNDKTDSQESSKADTVEISDTYKKTNTSVLRPDIEELVNYVKDLAKLRKPPVIEEGAVNAPKPPSAEDIERMKAHAEDIERSKKMGAKGEKIIAKMKSGQRLTKEEMDFLKETDPELYMEAKRMEAEREQFRNQLRNCHTKEERTRLVLIKKQMLAEEAKIILRGSKNTKEPVFVLGMMAAIDREVEEDDKRNGIVKKADREEAKDRNGKVNAEISSVEDIS